MIRVILFLSIVVALILSNIGCKKDSPVQPYIPTLPALTDSIAFSNLGQGKLAFQRLWWSTNSTDGVYLLDANKQLVSGVKLEGMGPAISRDGSKIAFTSIAGLNTLGDVYVMDDDGSNLRRISDLEGQERSPTWDKVGNIFFYSFSSRSRGVASGLYRNGGLIIDFGGINPPYIYQPRDPVSVSSQGRIVVSVVGIRTFSLEGTDQRLITDSLSEYHSPSWSPDGQTIAVLKLSNPTSLQILSMNGDGSNLRVLLTQQTVYTTMEISSDNAYSLCWSPDGSKIAFNMQDGPGVQRHIYVVDNNGSNLRQITTASGVTDMSISWSN